MSYRKENDSTARIERQGTIRMESDKAAFVTQTLRHSAVVVGGFIIIGQVRFDLGTNKIY